MLHTGIEIAFETPNPEPPDEAIVAAYDDIKQQMKQTLTKSLDLLALQQDIFPVTQIEVAGKRQVFLFPHFSLFFLILNKKIAN